MQFLLSKVCNALTWQQTVVGLKGLYALSFPLACLSAFTSQKFQKLRTFTGLVAKPISHEWVGGCIAMIKHEKYSNILNLDIF